MMLVTAANVLIQRTNIGLLTPFLAQNSVQDIVDGLNSRGASNAITIPYPPKQKGSYICICRVNNLARKSGCPSFGYGFGVGNTAREARNAAEGMAQGFAGGKDTHHTSCKCRDPKGQVFNY